LRTESPVQMAAGIQWLGGFTTPQNSHEENNPLSSAI
jgi:hypothetical protein